MSDPPPVTVYVPPAYDAEPDERGGADVLIVRKCTNRQKPPGLKQLDDALIRHGEDHAMKIEEDAPAHTDRLRAPVHLHATNTAIRISGDGAAPSVRQVPTATGLPARAPAKR